jgi:hypothetical protein
VLLVCDLEENFQGLFPSLGFFYGVWILSVILINCNAFTFGRVLYCWRSNNYEDNWIKVVYQNIAEGFTGIFRSRWTFTLSVWYK